MRLTTSLQFWFGSRIAELGGYPVLKREQKVSAKSRLDIVLERGDERCYIEVKSVTMVMDDGCYAFPDSVTARGLKHLKELTALVGQGQRAAMLYLVQRCDGSGFRPAHEIDPAYADGLQQAMAAGVEAYAYQTRTTRRGITVANRVDLV